MNTDLKILQTGAKDSTIFPSNAKLMEGYPEWDWNPKWKQKCQKREFSSGSVAAENPMIGHIFSVQQLLSIPAPL